MPLTKLVNGVRVIVSPLEEAEIVAEGLDWENNVKPTLDREKSFIDSVVQAGSQFSEVEKLLLVAVWTEVQRYRIDNTARTPLVDAIQAVFPGQTKAQIGTTIENRVENFLTSAATALANKIKDGG